MSGNFQQPPRTPLRERFAATVRNETDEINDWINGPGQMWLLLIVIGLGIWFIVVAVTG